MATARSTSRKQPSHTSTRSTTRKAKAEGNSRNASTRSSTRRSSHTRASATTAHKTGDKTAHGQAWTDQHSNNPSSTGHGKAKKEPAKQNSRCWPGYEPVPGKPRGGKGSCKPKAHQTAAEKKSDAMAASASKLRNAGGNKTRANHSR